MLLTLHFWKLAKLDIILICMVYVWHTCAYLAINRVIMVKQNDVFERTKNWMGNDMFNNNYMGLVILHMYTVSEK